MKHSKHNKTAKRVGNSFAQLDIAFVGASCTNVAKWMDEVHTHIKTSFKTLLIDADHHNKIGGTQVLEQEQIRFYPNEVKFNKFDQKIESLNYDVALINGNHYKGAHQVVFILAEKEASLKKRLDQLDSVLCYILVDKDSLYDFLPTKNSQGNEIPVLQSTDKKTVKEILLNKINSQKASLMGVVLAGGKSQRMGFDKSQIKIYNKPQELHLLEMLEKSGLKSVLSKAKDNNINGANIVEDTFLNLGPTGGILSVFHKYPNKALLVVACDLMLLDKGIIETLIRERDTSKTATCIRIKGNEFPEPLVSIYEPKAYSRLLQFLALGYSCPRKMLINSDCKIIDIEDKARVRNVNTPEELEKIKRMK